MPKQQWAIGGSLAGDSAINSPRGTSRTMIEAAAAKKAVGVVGPQTR
ncbi:hypothetical protein ABIA39_004947 [Nocardia sp. GAS34]